MAGQKPHMDLLKEHKTLLDTYGSSHPGESAAKQADRSPNHVRSADSPIDLSVRNEDKKVENDEWKQEEVPLGVWMGDASATCNL